MATLIAGAAADHGHGDRPSEEAVSCGEEAATSAVISLDTALLVPPLNFAMVAPGVYRSGYPNPRNFPFLKRLGLKSILYMAMEDYSPEILDFLTNNNISIFRYKLQGNKRKGPRSSDKALSGWSGTDQRNHPILVHCNKGKHRAGCLVGCLRKLQQWSLMSIFDEYQRFAGKTVRIADQQFIELFDHPIAYDPQFKPDWL